MPRTPRVPPELLHRPFHRSEAAQFGISERMLNGAAWARLHPCVWVHRDHQMSHHDQIVAATLSMPDRAQLSHESRLQLLGLDIGDTERIHFTIAGDLHLATEGIFLHRTEVLPPLDRYGVTPAVAFIQFCATASVLDAIVAGDWLLHRRHMTKIEVLEVAHHHDWRPGARQAIEVLRWLNVASRSPKESEVRAMLVFAGLPEPEVNVPIRHGGQQIAIVDLLYEAWRLVLEYEGRQHAEDRSQFQIDIKRYARLREASYEYLQVTSSMTERPRALVLHVHQLLVRRGYAGPQPRFAARWESLWNPIVVPPRLRAVS